MAFVDRLESKSSYHNLASVGDSDSDDCALVNGIDQNNNDEASPHIPFKKPGFYRSVSSSAAYHWRREPLEEYARSGVFFFNQQRRRLRMSQTEMKTLSGLSESLTVAADSRSDVFLPSAGYLQRKSDASDDANDNTDASSYAGSQCGEEPSSGCDSSNDESDGDDSRDSTQMIRSSRENNSSGYSLNSNNNNNKKRSRQSTSSNPRSVNFRVQSPQRRIRKSFRVANPTLSDCRRPHHHSLQISSVRAASTHDCSTCLLEYNQRLIDNNGSSNIKIKDVNGKLDLYSRYFSDIFTTFLDSSWSWVLFITFVVYLGHWIIFGSFYWIFALANDDYSKMYGSAAGNGSAVNSTGDPCVYQVYDFVSAFLFSMESETTIGYGSRSITPACPVAVACLTIQCIVSGIFDTWVIGLVYARMARPDSRSKTVLFASKAVICKRDGKRCLLVRVANLRKSLLVNVSVRARMIACRAAETKEKKAGLDVMLEHHDVKFENSLSAFLTTPIEYCHVIDKTSPLYGIRADKFNRGESNYFELVFILTGTLESTGLTMQAQTSYLSKEIFYGHRYVPVVSKRFDKRRYDVNFKRFHEVVAEPLSVHQHSRSKEHKRAIEERRGTVTTLVEETEEDVLSTSDEVFTSTIDVDGKQSTNSWV